MTDNSHDSVQRTMPSPYSMRCNYLILISSRIGDYTTNIHVATVEAPHLYCFVQERCHRRGPPNRKLPSKRSILFLIGPPPPYAIPFQSFTPNSVKSENATDPTSLNSSWSSSPTPLKQNFRDYYTLIYMNKI